MFSAADEAGDRDLVAVYLRRRDEGAFRSLYRRHTPALLGLAARLAGGRRGEADEIVQEAWLRAAPALASFRWSSSLKTWLSGFVVNVWRERFRSSGREEFALRDASDPADPAPSAPIERIDLERAVAALPGGYRAVLVLHDVEGFTHEEIAGRLGIEAGTSKSQLARARQAMRVELSRGRAGAARRMS